MDGSHLVRMAREMGVPLDDGGGSAGRSLEQVSGSQPSTGRRTASRKTRVVKLKLFAEADIDALLEAYEAWRQEEADLEAADHDFLDWEFTVTSETLYLAILYVE